jgi:hypothetical protein
VRGTRSFPRTKYQLSRNLQAVSGELQEVYRWATKEKPLMTNEPHGDRNDFAFATAVGFPDHAFPFRTMRSPGGAPFSPSQIVDQRKRECLPNVLMIATISYQRR